MSATGISGTVNYPVYTTGSTKETVSKGAEKGDFYQAISGAFETGKTYTLYGKQNCEGEEFCVGSWVDTQSNTSFEFYRTQDFDAENPVYKVKAWDAEGNVTERMIDVSKVDTKNCDAVEMYAYSFHLKENGASFEDSVLKAAVANAVNRANERQKQSFSAGSYLTEKVNWVDIVKDIMSSRQKTGDWKGYLAFKKFLSFLL